MMKIRKQIVSLIAKNPSGKSGYGWAPREIKKALNIGPKNWRRLAAKMYADRFLISEWEKDKSKASLITIGNTKGLKYTVPKAFEHCHKIWRELQEEKWKRRELQDKNPPKIPHPRLQKVFDKLDITNILDFEPRGVWSTNRQLSTLVLHRPSLRSSGVRYTYAKVWVKQKYIEVWNSDTGFHGKKLNCKVLEYK